MFLRRLFLAFDFFKERILSLRVLFLIFLQRHLANLPDIYTVILLIFIILILRSCSIVHRGLALSFVFFKLLLVKSALDYDTLWHFHIVLQGQLVVFDLLNLSSVNVDIF